RMYRVCQEFSGFIGTARLCPHSFSPPRLITPLNSTREELVLITPSLCCMRSSYATTPPLFV
ncbi:hypothetical protein J6590_107203, partial [Homalodisca vitripennis]